MTDHPKLAIRGLYKIFGPHPEAMLGHVRGGIGKADLLAQHRHVIGLRDINVDIRRGEITVIMGLSGSGKSTLIRHLNGLIRPTAGEILLDGVDVAGLTGDALRALRRRRMSMVFQNFALMPHMKVLANVVMPQTARGDDAAQAEANALKWLDRLGLQGFEQHYPAQLSGGMQQRVGIARALAADTDVMLMDEAFSALDPLIRTDMQNLLIELQKELEKTIVFITHDLDESLKIADHLVILKDGVVVQQGKAQGIIMNPADAYIEKFVNDINLARVLRAGSVMTPGVLGVSQPEARVDAQDTLETLIARSQGEVGRSFTVMRDGTPAGVVHMADVFRALVPRPARTAEAPAPAPAETLKEQKV